MIKKMVSKYLLDSMDRFGDDLCEVLLVICHLRTDSGVNVCPLNGNDWHSIHKIIYQSVMKTHSSH
ncbi:unnamed protein product [Medioppia subpectinata]|uniref:Uncharacterized protein n=1 Tax=Medioppia subpectinata TaxID=1979941 RepID=A0A7R9PZB2_9ACAR|nr:unnamed protein product [Medioppia subpectinata]CAG2106907.1 unnamed protein product [Medioppia subpectinata]